MLLGADTGFYTTVYHNVLYKIVRCAASVLILHDRSLRWLLTRG